MMNIISFTHDVRIFSHDMLSMYKNKHRLKILNMFPLPVYCVSSAYQGSI